MLVTWRDPCMKAATGKGALVGLHSGVPELALFLCFDSLPPPPTHLGMIFKALDSVSY